MVLGLDSHFTFRKLKIAKDKIIKTLKPPTDIDFFLAFDYFAPRNFRFSHSIALLDFC